VAVATNDDARWLADYRPIQVDVSSLSKFASALRAEVEQNFRPHAKRVEDMLDPGVTALPPKPEVNEWEASRGQYEAGRDRILHLMQLHERITLEIAEAADLIARHYRESDQFASATVSDVKDAFSQAAKKYGGPDA
jgi:hypothetical protein